MTTPSQDANNSAASIAAKLIAFGDSLIKLHIPYKWGGTTIKGGFDCSGFTQFAYKHFGYKIPRTAEEQAHFGTTVPRNAIQPGDLLFYDTTHTNSHVAMYAGNGEQIVARHTGTFLQRQKVGSFTHAQRIIGTIPGGAVGGIAATPADLLSGGLADLIPTPQDVWSAIGASLGVSDMKDALQRLGLILFGGGLLLYGIKLMASGSISKAMNATGGESNPEKPEASEEESNAKFQSKVNRRIAASRRTEENRRLRDKSAQNRKESDAMEHEMNKSSVSRANEEALKSAANA